MDQTRILDLPLSWPATWLSSQPIVRGPVAVRGLRDASKLPPGWVANNAVIKRDGWFPTKPTEYRQEACYYPSNVDWCKWSGWLYFPPAFRQLSWHCPSKLSTIQWGRYLKHFHSRPMLWSECSQYLGRRLNMGVDNFCWWLTFLWLVLCLIVLVTVGWQFSHKICYWLMIVYFWYCTFYAVCVLELVTLCILELVTVYEHLFLVSCYCWSD